MIVVVLAKYANVSFLGDEILPPNKRGVEEVVGFIPFDVFSSETGYDRDLYYKIEYPIVEIRYVQLKQETINSQYIIKGDPGYMVDAALQYELEHPTPSESEVARLP